MRVRTSPGGARRGDGWRYFVVVVPEDAPLEDSRGSVEVPPGSRRVTVTPRTAGLNAVRVYRSPPEQPRYVAGRKVRVTP
ncbi:MAG: hypothetical protein HY906_18925 [Deltaproteobacteria bacterium]|nr:hypothetical protein [Deltaproteobacteria bacterium]